MPTGQLALVSSTLDATAPGAQPRNDMATDPDSQTSRMNFSFPIFGLRRSEGEPGGLRVRS